MAEIPSPIRPEIAGKPETPNKIQLQTNWNAMESFFQDKDSMATPRIKQNIAALNDPDKSGYDPRDLSKKIKIERVDAGGKPLPAEEMTIQQVIKESVDELERLADLKPAADAPAEEAAKITAQAAEAQKLLEEMDKSLEVEVKGEARPLTREVYKARVKAARKQATDDAPQKYAKEKSASMDDPPTVEQVVYIAAKAKEAEDQLEGKFGLKYQFEYNPAEVIDPENIMEITNQAIEDQIFRLETQIMESNDVPKIVEWMGEIGTLRLAKMFDGKTALGAYGKYQALKKYNTGEDRRTGFAVAKLAGYETEEGGKKEKVAGLMKGWEKGLDEIPGLVEYFKENGLEAFVSLAAISELHAISAGDATKLPAALEALKKKIGLPEGVPLPVDMKEGTMDRLLFDSKTGLLDKLNQAIYGRTNVTLSEITAETSKGLSKQLIKKLKEHLKTMWGYTKSGTLILMLLALMMSSEGEQGGGGQQGG